MDKLEYELEGDIIENSMSGQRYSIIMHLSKAEVAVLTKINKAFNEEDKSMGLDWMRTFVEEETELCEDCGEENQNCVCHLPQ